MKKKAKQLLVAVFFGVILLTSTIAIAINANTNTNTNIDTTDTSPTGTPADNYPVDKRITFCGTNSTKSNRYITEFNVPTFCAQPLAITTDSSGNVWQKVDHNISYPLLYTARWQRRQKQEGRGVLPGR